MKNIVFLFLSMGLSTVSVSADLQSTGTAQLENSECPNKVRMVRDHKNIFRTLSVSPIREGSTGDAIGFRFRDLKEEDILSQYGIRKGDLTYEVCGVAVREAFQGGFDQPVCCKDGYPKFLSIRVHRSLIETFLVKIPLN